MTSRSSEAQCQARRRHHRAEAAGVSVVADASCAAGGIGCFEDKCRICKNWNSSKSSVYRWCTEFGLPQVTAPPTASPTVMTPTPTTPGPSTQTTPYPTTLTPTTPVPKTPAPTTLAPSTLAPKSPTPTPTPTPTTVIPTEKPIGGHLSVSECIFVASAGDAAAGIRVVTDTTCVGGGIGCFESVCRFCRASYSDRSSAFLSCDQFNVGFTQAQTATPTSTPAVVPATATPATPAPVSRTCAQAVSPGDRGVGISAYDDATCLLDSGVGCFQGVCRYCKTRNTPQSQHFRSCDGTVPASTPAAPTPVSVAPTPTPAVATRAPVTSTPAPEATPTPASVMTPTLVPVTPSVAPIKSTAEFILSVSLGDQNVRISAYCDTSCKTHPGLGCFLDTCRLCKTRDSDQSKHLLPCPTSAATTTPTPTTAKPTTPAPTTSALTTPTPTAPALNEPTGGSLSVDTCPPPSAADVFLATSVVADARCLSQSLPGCFAGCRRCATVPTHKNSYLQSCDIPVVCPLPLGRRCQRSAFTPTSAARLVASAVATHSAASARPRLSLRGRSRTTSCAQPSRNAPRGSACKKRTSEPSRS